MGGTKYFGTRTKRLLQLRAIIIISTSDAPRVDMRHWIPPGFLFDGQIVLTRLSRLLVFRRKKTATAVAFAKQGRGLIKVNGQPIENIEPEALRLKVFEPVLIVGQDKFSNLDIRIRVKGGGITAQIYAIRAAIAKSIVAYYAKYVDEQSKNELRKTLIEYDRNMLVSDPRRCEPKKYGGRSARSRFQKSYR